MLSFVNLATAVLLQFFSNLGKLCFPHSLSVYNDLGSPSNYGVLKVERRKRGENFFHGSQSIA